MPRLMRPFRGLLVFSLTLTALAQVVPAQAVEMVPRRWLGAEGGFGEVACLTSGQGCLGLSSVTTFGGQAGSQKAGVAFRDGDLVERVWPSRTGYRYFRTSVPGGAPATAALTTAGANEGSAPPLTVSFGLRFNTLPLHPVVIYRQTGASLEQTVTLTLTPEGRIAVSGGGATLFSSFLTTQSWHSLTVTYGGKKGGRLRFYVNDQPVLDAEMPFGGPSGPMELGIVSPVMSPFALGIDDLVEVPLYDQPIRKARINYLMPLGAVGQEEWTKTYPYEPCNEKAETWQLVSEDQKIFLPDPGDGSGTVSCELEGSSILATEADLEEKYHLEGIPSGHERSEKYHRDTTIQPDTDDRILGTRLRLGAYTDSPDPVAITLGLIDQGEVRAQDFEVRSGSITSWTPTFATRGKAGAWTADALNGAKLLLNSGPAEGVARSVSVVRLDYVWVPS